MPTPQGQHLCLAVAEHTRWMEKAGWQWHSLCSTAAYLPADGKIGGFNNPLHLNKSLPPSELPFVQILNANGFHWVVAFNIGCDAGTIRLYDSRYKRKMESDDATKSLLTYWKWKSHWCLSNLWTSSSNREEVTVVFLPLHLQHLWCFGSVCPTGLRNFNQKMRQHLLDCIDKKELTPFPWSQHALPQSRVALLHCDGHLQVPQNWGRDSIRVTTDCIVWLYNIAI